MNDKKTIEKKDNSINISEETLQDIANRINENCDSDKIWDILGIEDGEVTTLDVKAYIISTINSNLQYDFNVRFK